MNWKCPVCGSTENLTESLRCVCDHEINENELEHLTLPPPEVHIYSSENKYGNASRQFHLWISTLQALSFAAVVLIIIFASEKALAVAAPFVFGVIMILITTETIVKKQINIRYYVVRRQEIPSMYNTFLLLEIVMGIAFFGKFVYAILK